MIATNNNRHPGDAEYLAAAAALCEQTPSPAQDHGFAVGDWVNGTSGGKPWSGRIVSICGSRIDIEADMAWLTVDARDITH